MEFNKLRCELAKLKHNFTEFYNNNDVDIEKNVIKVLDSLRHEIEQTESDLEELRRKNATYSQNLKELMEKRLNDLSMKVQNTHDESVHELSDLNHKLAKARDKNNQLNHSCRILRIANNKIELEISNIRKYCPLIKDKVILEREKIVKIEVEIETTKQDVKATLESLHQHELELQRFKNLVENERRELRLELSNAEQRLRDKIKIYKDLCDLAITLQEETEKAIKEKKEAEEMAVKLESMYQSLCTEHEELQVTYTEEKEKLTEVESAHYKISSIVKRLKRQIDTRMNGKLDRELKEHKAELQKQKTATKDMEESRDNLLTEIESKRIQIEQLKQKIEEDYNKANACKERQKSIEELFKSLFEEFRIVSKEKSDLKLQLEREEKGSHQHEAKLRVQLERIQTEVEQEIVTRTNIMAQMRSDIEQLEQAKAEALEKRASLILMAETAEKKYEAKKVLVSQLEKTAQSKISANETLQKKFTTDKSDWEIERNALEDKLKGLQTKSSDAQNQSLILSKKCHELKTEIEEMENNRKQLITNLNAVIRSKMNNQRDVVQLEKELYDYKLLHCREEKTHNQIKSTTAAELKRQIEHTNEHFEVMNDRKEVYNKLQKQLYNEQSLNKQLSDDFKNTQNQRFSLDSNFNELAGNNNLNNTLMGDMKQILSWMLRMECQNNLNWNRDKKLTEMTFTNACRNLIRNNEKIKVFQNFIAEKDSEEIK